MKLVLMCAAEWDRVSQGTEAERPDEFRACGGLAVYTRTRSKCKFAAEAFVWNGIQKVTQKNKQI